MSVKNAFSWSRRHWPLAAAVVVLALVGDVSGQFGGTEASGQGEATTSSTLNIPYPPAFANGLPRLQQFLAVAVERHPDVVIARSKVEAARADLLKAEATALKELLQLHNQAQSQRAALESARREHAKNPQPGGNQKLVAEAATLSLVEWEITLAMGFPGLAKPHAATTSEGQTPHEGSVQAEAKIYVDVAYPKGQVATQVKDALGKTVDLSLPKGSLSDLCENLTSRAGVQVVADDSRLEEHGFGADTEIENLKIKAADISLASLLQQIEDRFHPLRFVVRDYGLLLTIDTGEDTDAVSVRDFANLTEEEIREKHRARIEDMRNSGGGVMGGMGGGGGGFF